MATKRTASSTSIRKMIIGSIIMQFLAMPMIILGALVDGLIVGDFLGIESIMAFGLVRPVNTIFNAIAVLFSIGTQALLAKEMGLGNIKKANQILTVVAIGAAIFSVVLVILGFVFIDAFATLLGASGDSAYLHPYVKDYLMGFIPAVPGFIFVLTFGLTLQLDSDMKRLAISAIAMTVLSITGDLLAVFVFQQGLFGVALATTISYPIAALIIFGHFFKPEATLHFTFEDLDPRDLAAEFKMGAPSASTGWA